MSASKPKNDTQADAQQDEPKAKRKSGLIGKLFKCFVILINLLVILVALTPMILSSSTGKNWALGMVNDALPGEVEIDSLSLAWFGGQRIDGLRVKAPDGSEVVNVASVDVPDVGLFSLLTGNRDFGKITVDKPVISAKQDAAGRINLVDAFVDPNKPKSNEPTTIPSELLADVELVEPKVSFSNAAIKQATWSDKSLTVTLGADTLEVKAPTATVQVDAAAAGDDAPLAITEAVSADAPIRQVTLPRTADGFFDFAKAEVDVQITAKGDLKVRTPEGEALLKNADGLVRYTPDDRKLHVKFTGATQRGADTGDVNVLADVTDPIKADGSLDTEKIRGIAEASAPEFPSGLVDIVDPNNQLVTEAAGPTISLTARAELKPSADGKSASGSLTLSIESDRIKGDITGQIKDNLLTVDKDPSLNALLTPDLFDKLRQRFVPSQSVQIVEATTLKLKVNALQIPLAEGAGDRKIDVRVEADPVTLKTDERLKDLVLNNLAVVLPDPGDTDNLIVNVETDVDDAGTSFRLTVDTTLEPTDKGRAITSVVSVMKPPVHTLKRFTGAGDTIGKLAGLIALAQYTYTSDPRRDDGATGMDVVVQSPGIALDIKGLKTDKAMSFSAPTPATITITPDRFTALMRNDDEPNKPVEYELAAPATFKVALNNPTIAMASDDPGEGEQRVPEDASGIVVAGTKLNVAITGYDLTLRHKTTGLKLVVSNLKVALANEGDGFALKVTGDTANTPANGNTLAGKIDVDLLVADAADQYGRLNMASLKKPISRSSKLEGLPVALLDALKLGGGIEYAKLLGATADGTIDGGEGDTTLQVSAPYAQATVRGLMDKGALKLKDNAEATLDVTPYLSEKMLAPINPLWKDATAEKPITLTIQKDGFVWPMQDFDIKTAAVKGRLDLGALNLQKSPLMSLILRGLKQPASYGSSVKFTPMTFELKDGVVSYDNVQFTMDNISLRMRGNVNLTNEQMNIKLGISGATLSQGFKEVRQFIDPNDFYEIPLTGTRSNPQLDFGGLVSQIVTKGAKGLLENKAGGLLDNLLNKDKKKDGDERILRPPNTPDTPPSNNDDRGASNDQPNDAGDKKKDKPDAADIARGIFDLLDKNKDEDKEDKREFRDPKPRED